MRFAAVRALADAVLFEGYALYPYRSSALKNRLRWQFGVLWPRAAGGADSAAGPSALQSEVLIERPRAAGAGRPLRVEIRLRFLRLLRRELQASTDDGRTFRPAASLEVDGQLLLGWEEGETVEVDLPCEIALDASRSLWRSGLGFSRAPFETSERIADRAGRVVGRWRRSASAVNGQLVVWAEEAGEGMVRLRMKAENMAEVPAAADRDQQLARSLIGSHVLLASAPPGFISLLEPPGWAEAAAQACLNSSHFPVLAGEPGRRDLVLVSPILLYDHPGVAPESPGDFFDASEIDELLSLRTLTLTDEEKRQARATDPRVAALLDRVHGLSPEAMERLHGTLRERRVLAPEPPGPVSEAEPELAAELVVDGVRLGPGSRVRLRPGPRRTDAQDMFLDGLLATVEAVKHDVDGSVCLAVTVDNDPAAELHRWKGRYHYFRSDEIEMEAGP